MTQKPAQNPHSFFYVVMFMALVVVGTVVAYFAFLPKSAPKQITLAVLPFGGSATVPDWLRYGLPADIRNELSLSRDVKVIDFQAAVDSFDEGYDFESITYELGASHFVDGSFEDVQQDFSGTITVRLVNATQAAWKEVWTATIAVESGEWEKFRQSVARTIREKLYDLSTPRELGLVNNANSYYTYLMALQAFHERDDNRALTILNEISLADAAPYMRLLKRHLSTRRDGYLYDVREMFEPTEAQFLLDELHARLRASGDLQEYKLELENLVSEYPNSVAVSTLADLYLYAGWLRQSKQLLIRWAQLRPQSFNVGVRLAQVDFSRNDMPGVMRSIQIAGERSKRADLAGYWLLNMRAAMERMTRLRYDEEPHQTNSRVPRDLDIRRSRHPNVDPDDCDTKLPIALNKERLGEALDVLTCAQRLWVTPPIFWRTTDPNWVSFTSTDGYRDYLLREGYASPNLEGLGPANVEDLFMPRRD